MPQHEGLSWLPFWEQRGEAEPGEEGGMGRREPQEQGAEASRPGLSYTLSWWRWCGGLP